MALTDGFRDRDKMRVGDAEREACLSMLTEHFALGRLTADELDQRQRATLRAVTRDDIAELLSDLPTLASPVGLGLAERQVRPLVGPKVGPSGRVAQIKWLVARALPAGVLYGGAFVAQGGDSGDWWHLNGDISTGLIMASFGYATHVVATAIRGRRKKRGDAATNGPVGLIDPAGTSTVPTRKRVSEDSGDRRRRNVLGRRAGSLHCPGGATSAV